MKRIVLIGAFAVSSLLPLGAQNDGGISDGMLQRIRASYEDTPADRALRNAICNNDIRKLVVNQPNQGEIDTYFSHRVLSKGVTDQQQSGRCWLFSGLNVLRARMIARYGLGAFEFSQNYCFFWDQLEKANLFLQGVIDTRDAPREDRTVEWLFKNPLSDGGQFTGVADIVGKYGLVPKEAMPETYSSEHTAQMAALLKLKLREYGLSLREAARDGAEKAELESRKTEMLPTINLILPYKYPHFFSGVPKRAIYALSETVLASTQEILRVLEKEHLSYFGKSLTLKRLGEAVFRPRMPDRGGHLSYDLNIPASVYVQDDINTLHRMQGWEETP